MCLNCAIETVMDAEYVPDDWKETIQWPEITPEMAEGVLLIRHLYDEKTGLGCFTGGPLHVFLDDYNCDDHTMGWYASQLNLPDPHHTADMVKVAKKIHLIAEFLDEKQRITMVSCAHDNIPPLPEGQ